MANSRSPSPSAAIHAFDSEAVHISRDDVAETLLSRTLGVSTSGDLPHCGTSAVLYYCKRNLLQPYLRLLSFLACRPSGQDSVVANLFSRIYAATFFGLLTLGVALQYFAHFRHGKRSYPLLSFQQPLSPSANSTSRREIDDFDGADTPSLSHVPAFILPHAMFLVAYLHFLLLMRWSDGEPVEVFMEQAFFKISFPATLKAQKEMISSLRYALLCGFLWVVVVAFLLLGHSLIVAEVSFPEIINSDQHFFAKCRLHYADINDAFTRNGYGYVGCVVLRVV